MNKHPTPPKFFHRFFRWFCHPDLLSHIEGDLMELYAEKLKESGKRKADLKFAIDVLLLFRPGIIRPAEGFNRLNNYGMFKNYFKVGIRNVLKYKAFSFINVFGLAVAMSVCMMIILMVADQKSYDQFHEKKDRIYRILSDRDNAKVPSATTPFPLAHTLSTDYPIIEQTTQLTRGVGGEITYDHRTAELRGYFADNSFFEVFSYDLEQGNKNNALIAPNSIVITKASAQQLFKDENPIGKAVHFVNRGLSTLGDGPGNSQVDWGLYTVTGVIAEGDHKSHLKFDALVSSSSRSILIREKKLEDNSYNWANNSSYTYVLLKNKSQKEALSKSLGDLVKRKHEELTGIKGFKLIPQALDAITPGILVGNESSYTLPAFVYYFLSFLALVIMVSACLNYTNLSTARVLSRAKEIGVRKVSGAYRHNIVLQFLCESLITALLALVMAMLLLIFLKPALKGLWINEYLKFDLRENIFVYFIFAGLALVVGLVAGLYPALFLSKFQPCKSPKKS